MDCRLRCRAQSHRFALTKQSGCGCSSSSLKFRTTCLQDDSTHQLQSTGLGFAPVSYNVEPTLPADVPETDLSDGGDILDTNLFQVLNQL